MNNYKDEWLGNVKEDLLAGLVVCMALIPEVIGFTIVAGVEPMVGIYTSFCFAIVTSIFGGRTGMISAAAGSMAFVLVSLVRDYGVQYMLVATILTGIFQIILGYLKVGKLLKFIPEPVIVGFVNGLGILMFKSQIEHFQGSIILPILGLIGIAIIYLLPNVTKIIPSPIIAVIVISLVVTIFKIDIKTLGDMGKITTNLPTLSLPKVPFNFKTLSIVLPYSISLAIVGLVESLLTAGIVDDRTETHSNKNKEAKGQGLANIVTGFFGGIAGCGMIGQTVVNQEYGGRGRLSSLSAGLYMLFFIIVLNRIVIKVPIVALASVMVVVAITTFDWNSIKTITKVPITDTIVMLSTVIIVLFTNNLAYGVVLGILLSSIFLVNKLSVVKIEKINTEDKEIYIVKGQLYFASTEAFRNKFDYNKIYKSIEINLAEAQVCDQSAVIAIDKVIERYKKYDVNVKLVGVSERSKKLINRISKFKDSV